MAKHYDVAVLGTGLGALTAAALLARRSWRVLVLGQGSRPQTYHYDGIPLARRPFAFVAQSSPAWGRVLAELAQSQTFKRRLTPLDPMFQYISRGVRLDVPPDMARFADQLEREYAPVRRVIESFYGELGKMNALVDSVFEKDLVWPPGSFWERRETARIPAILPQIEDNAELAGELAREHEFRNVIDAPAQFASHATNAPPFALARLHGAWTRGVMRMAGGEDELVDFLIERVRAHGGDADLSDRALQIVHKRGRVQAVATEKGDSPTGVQFVVSGLPGRSLMDLATGFEVPRRTAEGFANLVPRQYRFVVSMMVRKDGLPAALANEVFLSSDARKGGVRETVHLQRVDQHQPSSDHALLIAETLLADATAGTLARARERILRLVEDYLPFIERHYIVVDSPHDGRPLWDYRKGERREMDRAMLRGGGALPHAEPMNVRWHLAEPDCFGLASEPVRTPLTGAFLSGPSVLPGLGQEGELLAAWSAARLITRTDKRKEKMRREMWTKVEIG